METVFILYSGLPASAMNGCGGLFLSVFAELNSGGSPRFCSEIIPSHLSPGVPNRADSIPDVCPRPCYDDSGIV